MDKLTDKEVKAAVARVDMYLAGGRIGEIDPSLAESVELINTIAHLILESKLFPSPPDKLLEHMTEPELGEHLRKQLRFIKACQSEDTVGSMLIIFQKDMICQYGATLDPETVPQALRELATRLERRETVKR